MYSVGTNTGTNGQMNTDRHGQTTNHTDGFVFNSLSLPLTPSSTFASHPPAVWVTSRNRGPTSTKEMFWETAKSSRDPPPHTGAQSGKEKPGADAFLPSAAKPCDLARVLQAEGSSRERGTRGSRGSQGTRAEGKNRHQAK
ncbi:unnamed protein product [Pleuronectes platessa]|uniref:Uncharacterized protein n=1 Tax=Pleuronectes platessa TaxID=8262 RepID=A0A9N7UTH7_PLEPL|nr:unnamed protein product [Pleuronectes platessa]